MTTLDVEIAAATSRRWWNRWTLVLGITLVVAGGFVAGIEVQKAFGEEETTSATGMQGAFGGAGGFPGGSGGFPGGAQGGSEPEPTTGTVKLIDGTTVYVETESGELITIRTNGETTVNQPGALKDLKAGDKVTVEGDTDAEGTVTADSVTETK